MKKEAAPRRNAALDLLRVLAAVFVIIIHSTNKPWQNFPFAFAVITILTYSCNPVFYMISGRFNLSYEFKEKKDYVRYYQKRLLSIFLPYVVVSLLLSVWNMALEGVPWTQYPREAWSDFFSDNSATQLWFMYPLLGMILSTPFLSKMFHAMSDAEIRLMAFLSLAVNFVKVYLVTDLGVTFSYSGWVLDVWVFSFCAGYFCLRLIRTENKRKVYLLGLAGFVVSVLHYWLFPENRSFVTDLAPAFCLFYVGLYTLVEKELVIRNRLFCRILRFLARYSYVMYLVEWHIQRYVTPKLTGEAGGILRYAAGIAVTFALSLLVSVVLNTVLLSPLQKKIAAALGL